MAVIKSPSKVRINISVGDTELNSIMLKDVKKFLKNFKYTQAKKRVGISFTDGLKTVADNHCADFKLVNVALLEPEDFFKYTLPIFGNDPSCYTYESDFLPQNKDDKAILIFNNNENAIAKTKKVASYLINDRKYEGYTLPENVIIVVVN